MNTENLTKVIQEYINNFDLVNNDIHREYSKWYAFKRYYDNFDLEAEDFASMFKNAIKDAAWLVDNSFVCPTNGVAYFAEKPETKEQVRELFRALYADDGGDLNMREEKVWKFVDDFNDMLRKYEPNKWKFKQEFRYGLFYLTLMYPDENFNYKASQARAFSQCIEFDRPLGSGKDFSLKNYYSMCEVIIEQVKNTPQLLQLHRDRLKDNMYPDDELHLLAFDIIYCAVQYGMYAGIEIKKPEKLSAAERAERARLDDITNQLSDAQNELNHVLDLYDTMEGISVIDTEVEHKRFGKGIVKERNDTLITVQFGDKRQRFQLPTAYPSGLLNFDDESVIEFFTKLYETEKRKIALENRIKNLKFRLER